MPHNGPKKNLEYERTLMCGRFRSDLQQEAAKIGADNRAKSTKQERDRRKRNLNRPRGKFCSWLAKCHAAFVDLIGEDWLFLALLGVIMAFCSFIMDYCIEKIQEIHMWLFKTSVVNPFLQYTAWVSYTLVLVLFSTGFVHAIAPQAIGSGIPEMKTILRGVVLKEYLTFRTLIAKMVGLTVSLGSGLPVGKEGPFVHVASIVATLLSKLITSFKGIFENESRSSEMLAAACAVGVACTFGAPVGGILFSIEVTSVYFAVRNYWRGFFAAACSATVFRLLAVGFKNEVTVVAFFKTHFPSETPFYPEELIVFALIGVVCGFGGALFVATHRSIVVFIRKNRIMKAILSKNRFLYPAMVALVVSSLTFPLGYGKYMSGNLTFRGAIEHFFSNFSWNYSPDLTVQQMKVVEQWTTEHTNIYVTLALYCITIFCLSAFANTLPLPAGVFTPVFVIGASFGRLVGESMYAWFPEGIRGTSVKIVPGGYAVVGAAAFAGSVTHTVSVSVILFELTGQLAYILPVMIAVLIANAVCAKLQPSIYDSIIRIKHLPYLPDILPTSSAVHKLLVEEIMVRDIRYLSKQSTYRELQDLLMDKPRLRAFPLVDKPESMILLGSIPRTHLDHILELHIGQLARQTEAVKRRGAFGGLPTTETSEFSSEGEEKPLTARSMRPRSDSRFTVTRVTNSNESKTPEDKMSPRSEKIGTDADLINGEKEYSVHLPHSFSSPSTLTKNYSTTLGTYARSLAHKLRKIGTFYRNESENFREIDMTDEEAKEWENQRLGDRIDFANLQVDPAPFQLVERTSLYKVHSLFSLLGLNRAYVTALGRLVGVVALRELRGALESTQWFNPPSPSKTRNQLSLGLPSESDPESGWDNSHSINPAVAGSVKPVQLRMESFNLNSVAASETDDSNLHKDQALDLSTDDLVHNRKLKRADSKYPQEEPEIEAEIHNSSESETGSDSESAGEKAGK